MFEKQCLQESDVIVTDDGVSSSISSTYNFMTIDAMQIGAAERKLRYDRDSFSISKDSLHSFHALTTDPGARSAYFHRVLLWNRPEHRLQIHRSRRDRWRTTSQLHHLHPLHHPHTRAMLPQNRTSSHNSTTSSPTTSSSSTPTTPSAPASRPSSAPASCPSPTPIEMLRPHSAQDDAMDPQSLTAG